MGYADVAGLPFVAGVHMYITYIYRCVLWKKGVNVIICISHTYIRGCGRAPIRGGIVQRVCATYGVLFDGHFAANGDWAGSHCVAARCAGRAGVQQVVPGGGWRVAARAVARVCQQLRSQGQTVQPRILELRLNDCSHVRRDTRLCGALAGVRDEFCAAPRHLGIYVSGWAYNCHVAAQRYHGF